MRAAADIFEVLVGARDDTETTCGRCCICESHKALYASQIILPIQKGILVHMPPTASCFPLRPVHPRPESVPSVEGYNHVLALPN